MTQRSAANEPGAKQKSRSTRKRRRSRYEAERGDGHWLRLIVIVGSVGLVAAAILFWNRSGDPIDTGIGERFTVVTADTNAAGTARPRSGSVTIEDHEATLVPERPTGAQSSAMSSSSRSATTGSAESTPAAPAPSRRSESRRQESPSQESPSQEPPNQEQPSQELPQQKASAGQPQAPAAVPGLIEPGDQGGWALQIGAFGSKENAESLIASLRDKGFTPKLRAESSANGDIFYRVWIGYFPSRTAAERYGRARTADLGETYPVHR